MQEGMVWFFPFEETLIVWLQQLGAGTPLQDILNALNNFFSFLGEELIGIAIMGVLYWGLDKEKGKRVGASILLANLSVGMIKNIFTRLRPWVVSERITLLREVDGFSFPSGHSANCASLYPTVAREYKHKKWLTWAAVAVPLLCGVSRCYVGAHWPTDVLAGLFVGLLSFFIIEWAVRRMKRPGLFYAALIPIGALGMLYCTTGDYFSSFGMVVGFVFGTRFEEKYVRFENTQRPAAVLLRTLAGGGLFFILNGSLRFLLGGLFLAGTMGALLMRFVRYALVVFLLVGVYPYAFRLEEKPQGESLRAAK